MSVETTAKPYCAPAPMSSQLMPPAKPPVPTVRRRVFHVVGRKRPKRMVELVEVGMETVKAQSSGREVGAMG